MQSLLQSYFIMPRLRNQEAKILKLWKSISFPGAFSNSLSFCKELKKHANIDISQKALDELIHKDLVYQMSHIKPYLKSKTRKVASSDVTIQVGKQKS